jgi:hypothetical protein
MHEKSAQKHSPRDSPRAAAKSATVLSLARCTKAQRNRAPVPQYIRGDLRKKTAKGNLCAAWPGAEKTPEGKTNVRYSNKIRMI